MNLPTTNSTHYFVPVDGVIKLIKDMPEKPVKRESFESYAGTVYMGGDFGYEKALRKYDQALQSAIQNAIKVSNQKDVGLAILRSMRIGVRVSEKYFDEQITRYLTNEKVYSLQCRVEIEEWPHVKLWGQGYHINKSRPDRLALVTFDQASEPENETMSIIEKAFVAGRSKQSWESFKKDHNL